MSERAPSEYAQAGYQALVAYQRISGNDWCVETLAVDLIADLLHYVSIHQFTPEELAGVSDEEEAPVDRILRKARTHYETERDLTS